jgi:hypothetical protein
MAACTTLIHERALQLLQSPMSALYRHIVGRVSQPNAEGGTIAHAVGSHIITEELTEVHHKDCDP